MSACLKDSSSGNHVPLEDVAVKVNMVDFTAMVKLIQTYRNVEDCPIEATYEFPIDDNAAVVAFEACIDGRTVVGTVKEKEEARQDYDDAITSGHGGYLLEQTSAEMFSLSVGNLPAGKTAVITIRYVTELDANEARSAIEFVLPTTVTQKYMPAAEGDEGTVSPSALSHTRSQPADLLHAEFEISAPSKVVNVSSLTHSISSWSATSRSGRYTATLKIGTPKRRVSLDREMRVTVHLAEAHKPRVWMETREGNVAAMLCFFPNMNVSQLESEIVFVLDRSGSMQGEPIASARETLIAALKCLPSSVLFNVVSFGSTYRPMFTHSKAAVTENITKAIRMVRGMNADLGGTALLQPLRFIYDTQPAEGRPRNVFLLTDGAVGNTDALTKLARQNAGTTRIFSFGIGTGVSRELVNGLARAGAGKSVFVTSLSDIGNLSEIVNKQLKRALQPALTNVNLSVGQSCVFEHAPSVLPPIFDQERYLVYAFLKPEDVAQEFVMEASSPVGPVQFTLKAEKGTTLSGDQGHVHQLAAKALIRELEEGEIGDRMEKSAKKARIIQLGTKYSLATTETSFVAVEAREDVVVQEMAHRPVPLQQPAPSFSSLYAASSVPPCGFVRKVGGGGSGPGRLDRHAGVRRSRRILYDSSFEPRPKRKCARADVQTPFGLLAKRVSFGFADDLVTHGICGPQFNAAGFDCWLSAALSLLLTIEPLRRHCLEIADGSAGDTSSPLLRAVAALVKVWVCDHNSCCKWRSRLNAAYTSVWTCFQALGFTYGEEHSPAKALLSLISTANLPLSECAVIFNFDQLMKCKARSNFIVFINHVSSHLPSSWPKGYELLSFISSERLINRKSGGFCGHLSTVALSNGYCIFDGRLRLDPGDFQGGIIPDGDKLYPVLLAELQEDVPVCVLRRKKQRRCL